MNLVDFSFNRPCCDRQSVDALATRGSQAGITRERSLPLNQSPAWRYACSIIYSKLNGVQKGVQRRIDIARKAFNSICCIEEIQIELVNVWLQHQKFTIVIKLVVIMNVFLILVQLCFDVNIINNDTIIDTFY